MNSPSDQIQITGACLHNLKDIDVAIPKNKLVVLTGVSGSGKSTLAFDLIFAEGRRRYLQALGMISDLAEDIGCQRITGLGPTIAVQQGIIRQSNPRSTVGSRSGIFTFLRMLYVHEGQRACPGCGALGRANAPCPHCQAPAAGLHSAYFSPNSSSGMCLQCEGRGYLYELNMTRLVPTPETTLRQLLNNAGSQSTFQYLLKGMLKEYADLPYAQAPEAARQHLLYGLQLHDGRVSHNLFDHLRWKLHKGRDVQGCIRRLPCPACQASRLGEEARQVTLAGQHIGQLSELTLLDLSAWMQRLPQHQPLSPLGRNLLGEVCQRLDTLAGHGLGHLTLYRETPSLSGGELQRLFLASHVTAQMDSLIYILDEPTVGLHEIEKGRLLQQLHSLRAQGNTVILVEHDPGLIAAAEHVIDIGPLAGRAGGQIVYQGDYAGLLAEPASLSGQYLSGRQALPPRPPAGDLTGHPRLHLQEVSTHNLCAVSVDIPLGALVGVAGVSGSGKSSLIMKTLVPLLEKHFNTPPVAHPAENEEEEELPGDGPFSGRLEGCQHLAGFSAVSQSPIGRNDNSNPATYLGIWDTIRKVYARLPEAQALGYGPGHFSFNAAGACPTCSGSGKQRLWLGSAFFATNPCPQCQGRRFNDAVLQIRWRGKNILDVLSLSAAEALAVFAEFPAVCRTLETLVRSGMGYILLGQPAPTLSGGEAQRIKLAAELCRPRKGHILYIFDEPTTGLSLYDTTFLLRLLDELVRQGNSALVIEHDPLTLARCDWIVELGPGGGSQGGQIIAAGTPHDLRHNPASRLGPYLPALP